MARKKKIHIEKHPGVPRGCEFVHGQVKIEDLPGRNLKTKDLRLDDLGREISDPTPVAVPVKGRPWSIDELRNHRQLLEESAGQLEVESFDEANDFDMDDEFGEFVSVWEKTPDDELAIADYKRFKETGEIPDHMVKTLQRFKDRESFKTRQRQQGAPLPENKPPVNGDNPHQTDV